jgi:N-acyl-D-aspartate/D-glutamate deacylase
MNMAAYDLVIRGGTLVDGSGQPARDADVAVTGDRIMAVGRIDGAGQEEIDARGQIVTPGFVDIHTHYDGQVTWTDRVQPSSLHGVSTVVMGNCGVGFAPCRRDQHELLLRLMEGVEDIPYPVLAEGVPWTWESFPEYLDTLAARQYDLDVSAFVPHAALRIFVMGERAARLEAATADDMAGMAQTLAEAMDAGAMGFGTSQTMFHRSATGVSTPSFVASEDELMALAMALKDRGRGVIQHVTDWGDPQMALRRMRHLVERSGRPLTFTLTQHHPTPDMWREILSFVSDCNRDGLPVKAQVMTRPVGLLLGHELTLNPFYSSDLYRRLDLLPFEDKIAALRTAEVRQRLLAEPLDPSPANLLGLAVRRFDEIFELSDPPDYEPSPDQSIGARARRAGRDPLDYAYDLLLERDGRNTLYIAFMNYAGKSLDVVSEMLRHPDVVPALGDGGAHFGTICDASYSTYMLTHWARDRHRGEKMKLENVVRALTRTTAALVGFDDRGLVAPGYRADLNVIDFDGLRLHAPEVAADLPGGRKRLVQRADGYTASIVRGAVTYRNGEATGALPGRLVRGPQAAPG